MSSFRRRIMMAQSVPATYDYITDGLILHLDGIWNGGFGVHLGSTSTWVDLSPAGNNATSVNGTSIAFGSNYADFTSADGFFSLIGLDAGVSFTVEVWYKTKFSNIYCVGCWGYNNIYSFGLANRRFQYYGAGSPLYTAVDFYDHGAVTYDKSQPLFTLYNNGTQTATYTNTAPTGSNRATPAIGINRKFDSGQSFAGQVYMLRVYNRALSAEEIAYNTSLDNNRF